MRKSVVDILKLPWHAIINKSPISLNPKFLQVAAKLPIFESLTIKNIFIYGIIFEKSYLREYFDAFHLQFSWKIVIFSPLNGNLFRLNSLVMRPPLIVAYDW